MNGDFAKRRCYSRRVRDSDPDGRRHFSGSVALGGSAALVQYSPTQRDDFVKCDSAGARPKNFQTLNGYEAGLFGMEGRGLYAGGNVGGVYAQVAQNGGWSYGFQEQIYLAYGNNTSKDGADGKTGSVVSAELWLPTLGKYGHFAFGATHDVSPEGVNKAQINQLKQLGFTDSEIKAAYGSRAGYEALQIKLVNMGFSVDHPYVDSDVHKGENGNPETKDTYSKNGEYGNIEFMIGFDNSYRYSSYNYGNNIFSHFVIDYVGYKGFINKW